MKRIDVERKLNDSRNFLLDEFAQLPPDHLHRPITASEHDGEHRWSALDHLSHLAFIETTFAAMIRRHVAGDENPVGLRQAPDGSSRSREEILALVHASNDRFQRDHHDATLSDVIALTAKARGETLTLLSELTDAQLDEALPGAPWGDGTLAGVLGANADHAQMHWNWIVEARAIEGDVRA